MKEYIGTKIIKAEPAYKVNGNIVTELPLSTAKNPKTAQAGYKVEYLDGYVSWSPADVFEESYRANGNLTFGHAIDYLKLGCKLARKGWNGKGMYIYLQEGSTISSDDARNKHLFDLGVMKIILNPHIDMKTADGSITIGWAPSQVDMLSSDWGVVE